MVVYCKKYDCAHNQKLEEPISFNFRKIYTPLGEDKCSGKCIALHYDFIPCGFSTKTVDYDTALCTIPQEGVGESSMCNKHACLWNKDNQCSRDEVMVDKLKVATEEYWVCRCYSNKSFSNHRDWTQNLKPDGTPKGGHIDDDYSEKLHHDNLVTKSFPDHTRQTGNKRK